MEDLDRIVAKFPKLEIQHRVQANDMRAHVNVPIPFLDAAIFVTEETPKIKKAAWLVPAEGSDTLQYLDAFRWVDEKLVAVRTELRFTMMSRRAKLALQALQVFSLARNFARDQSVAGIDALVEILRRTLGKRGRPRKQRAALGANP